MTISKKVNVKVSSYIFEQNSCRVNMMMKQVRTPMDRHLLDLGIRSHASATPINRSVFNFTPMISITIIHVQSTHFHMECWNCHISPFFSFPFCIILIGSTDIFSSTECSFYFFNTVSEFYLEKIFGWKAGIVLFLICKCFAKALITFLNKNMY